MAFRRGALALLGLYSRGKTNLASSAVRFGVTDFPSTLKREDVVVGQGADKRAYVDFGFEVTRETSKMALLSLSERMMNLDIQVVLSGDGRVCELIDD